MAEIKLTGPSMEQRIANRLRDSGGGHGDVVTKQGEGPTRVIHHVHHSGSAKTHGGDHGAGGPLSPGGAFGGREGRR